MPRIKSPQRIKDDEKGLHRRQANHTFTKAQLSGKKITDRKRASKK